MGYHRPQSKFEFSGVWIEYFLILVLVILVVVIAISLLGPYVSNQITEFIADLAVRTGE